MYFSESIHARIYMLSLLHWQHHGTEMMSHGNTVVKFIYTAEGLLWSCCSVYRVCLTVLCRNCNRLVEKQHRECPLERLLFNFSHSAIFSSHKHRCSHLNTPFCSPTWRALFSCAFVSLVRVLPHSLFSHTFEHYRKAGNWGLENIAPLGRGGKMLLFIFLSICIIILIISFDTVGLNR